VCVSFDSPSRRHPPPRVPFAGGRPAGRGAWRCPATTPASISDRPAFASPPVSKPRPLVSLPPAREGHSCPVRRPVRADPIKEPEVDDGESRRAQLQRCHRTPPRRGCPLSLVESREQHPRAVGGVAVPVVEAPGRSGTDPHGVACVGGPHRVQAAVVGVLAVAEDPRAIKGTRTNAVLFRWRDSSGGLAAGRGHARAWEGPLAAFRIVRKAQKVVLILSWIFEKAAGLTDLSHGLAEPVA
jgi:hypothetical protein